jgi:hypothetical protein
MCHVPGCTEKHIAHYCWICNNGDSDHFSRHCPNRHAVLMYHGTTESSFNKWIGSGGPVPEFDPKFFSGGNLGDGVYLTHNPHTAVEISKIFGGSNARFVFTVKVDLGDCVDCGTVSDRTGSWHPRYDSAVRLHEAWGNIPPFREYCVRDPTRCEIIEVAIISGKISAGNFPGLNIRFNGNCIGEGGTWGNVTCGGELFPHYSGSPPSTHHSPSSNNADCNIS